MVRTLIFHHLSIILKLILIKRVTILFSCRLYVIIMLILFIVTLGGYVRSVHDQRIFRLSEVQSYLRDITKFPDDCNLLGDCAYKLHDNLLVPYRDNGRLTEREYNYNFCHASTSH